MFYISKNTCSDIQTRVFGNQLAKECETWTNARSIVRTNFVRQNFRERLCRSSNLSSRLCTLWTHSPAGVKGYDFFHLQLANFGKHEQPTSLCTVLTFGLRKFEQRNFFLAFFGGRNWQDLSRHSCLFHFSKSQQRRSMQSATTSH